VAIDARLSAWLALHLVDGVGSRTLHALLSTFGSATAVAQASLAQLTKHVPERIARAIKQGPDAVLLAQTATWLDEPRNSLVAWDDADYPPQLLTIADPPPLLYVKGRRELLSRPSLAVVGSRNATPQGIETAHAFARTLSAAGLTVVSGLALGIDAAAHRGALAGAGSSVAVVGTGLDRVYPARNRELAHELAERGAVVSEFALGTPPVAGNFPRRNRLLSGLSQGCLVVEATIHSGSLITARLAGEQGREIFAIPGSIHSPFSKGCHKLIKEGAKLVEVAQDILEELHLAPAADLSWRDGDEAAPIPGATSDPERVMAALGFDTAAVDDLCQRTSFSAERVLAALLELELSGRVAPMLGGRYQRLH
jgi:DNA processing protein